TRSGADRAGRLVELPFPLPQGVSVTRATGPVTGGQTGPGADDAGLRFVDLDEDGHDDLVFSNDLGFGVYLYDGREKGWTRKVAAGEPDRPNPLPKDNPGG